MRQRYLILFGLFLSLTCTSAENTNTQVLDKIVGQLEGGKGFSTTFCLQQNDAEEVFGSIDVQKDRFRLQLPEMTTWFDGTTQWIYFESSQEINVTQPDEEDLWQINPYFLLRGYKRMFDPHFIGRTGNICEFSLTPKQPSEIKEIRLFIDEKIGSFSRITILQTEGECIQITITRYEKRENFPVDCFTCKKEDFPQAEFIDLR